MKLTIIPIDGTVNKDGYGYIRLDLSSCSIPSNIRVLQWENTSGWLEFWDKQNEDILELPTWANSCVTLWEETFAKEQEFKAKNAIPQEYLEDRENELKLALNQFPKVNANIVNSLILNNTFNSLQLIPYVRKHDNALIGIYFDTSADSTEEGSDVIRSYPALKAYTESKGIPLFGSTKIYKFNNIVSNYGFKTLFSLGTLYVMSQWNFDLAKLSKKTQINYERDLEINNGVTYNNNVWDADSESVKNMTAKLAITNDSDSVVWRTKTNLNITMTGLEFKSLVGAIVNAIDAIYKKSWDRKLLVDNASSENELNTI